MDPLEEIKIASNNTVIVHDFLAKSRVEVEKFRSKAVRSIRKMEATGVERHFTHKCHTQAYQTCV